MYKEDLLEILNQLRYINKDMKLDKANNKTPFLEAIERKIKEQPLVNEKTGMKYTNMNELMISSFKILEELYNGLTPLMTAVMYGAPLITIQQMIELNPKSLSIKSPIGWTCLHCITSDTPYDVIQYLLSIKYIEDTYRTKEGTTKYKYFDPTKIFDSKGRLPIHHAAYEGNVAAFICLYFKYKRSLNVKTLYKCGTDNTRKTPVDIALMRKENEIINICKRISEGGPTLSIAELAKDIGILHEFLKPRTSILCYDKQYEKQLIDKFAIDPNNQLDTDKSGRYITKRYHRSPFKSSSKVHLGLPPIHGGGKSDEKNPEEVKVDITKIWGVDHYKKLINSDPELKRLGYLPQDLYKEHSELSLNDQNKIMRVLIEMK